MATEVNAVATVGFNDRDVAVVQARAGGFVERVYARAPGDVIAAGAPLADVLVTEWAGAQEEFLAVRSTGDAELTAAARQRLLLLGHDARRRSHAGRALRQAERGDDHRVPDRRRHPGAGCARRHVGDARDDARAHQRAAHGVAGGGGARSAGRRCSLRAAAVEATFAAYPGQRFKGKIAAVLPEANAQTRTLRVRMELPNPGLRLKPGMFAQVRIAGQREEALVVPSRRGDPHRQARPRVRLRATRPSSIPVEVEVGQRDGWQARRAARPGSRASRWRCRASS